MKKSFSFQARFKSFTFAFNGLKILFHEEHNSRIHLLAMVLVSVAGYCFRISSLEWIVITLSVGLVFVTEIMNTAIETLCNYVSPGKNELIEKTKDLGAAAVLVAAISSIVVAGFIFIPKFFFLIG